MDDLDGCARCGHCRELHIPLVGYPGDAWECWADDDCTCGRFIDPKENAR